MYYVDDQMVEEIRDSVGKVARSGQFVLGPQTTQFETLIDSELFVRKVDRDYQSLLVSNGTVAIELALRALKANRFRGLRDISVLMPAMTVPMVKWAIVRAGCVPVPVDVDPLSHCMDPEKTLEEIRTCEGYGDHPLAVVFVYTGGLIPKGIQELRRECAAKHIAFVEDISHAYRSTTGEWHAGCEGDAVCGSMFATKVLSVGEGGIVRFVDKTDYATARLIRNQGRDDRGRQVMDNCYNFRASEYTAAVASVKLRHLHKEIAHRERVVHEVLAPYFLSKHSDIVLPEVELGVIHSYYKFIVQFKGAAFVEQQLIANKVPVSGAVHRDVLFPVTEFAGACSVTMNHICPPLNSVDHARAFIKGFEEVYARNN